MRTAKIELDWQQFRNFLVRLDIHPRQDTALPDCHVNKIFLILVSGFLITTGVMDLAGFAIASGVSMKLDRVPFSIITKKLTWLRQQNDSSGATIHCGLLRLKSTQLF